MACRRQQIEDEFVHSDRNIADYAITNVEEALTPIQNPDAGFDVKRTRELRDSEEVVNLKMEVQKELKDKTVLLYPHTLMLLPLLPDTFTLLLLHLHTSTPRPTPSTLNTQQTVETPKPSTIFPKP